MDNFLVAIQPYAIAALGGIVPSLLWLLFWLREDKKNPEPTGLIALSFMAGMVVVYFVLPVQQIIAVIMPTIMDGLHSLGVQYNFIVPPLDTVKTILWSFAEEFGKYATVFLVAYHTSDFDEPMDCVMYLITAALGFSAMENTLYILKDLSGSGFTDVLFNGNMRFLGATVVHTASSALFGIAFAFAYYRAYFWKIVAGFIGLVMAVLLHAYFNLSIIETHGTIFF